MWAGGSDVCPSSENQYVLGEHRAGFPKRRRNNTPYGVETVRLHHDGKIYRLIGLGVLRSVRKRSA